MTRAEQDKLLRKFEALLELVDQAVDNNSVIILTALVIEALETP